MSKEKILASIRKNKPQARTTPQGKAYETGFTQKGLDVIKTFQQSVETGAGKVFHFSQIEDLEGLLKKEFPEAQSITSQLDFISSNVNLLEIQDPGELKKVDIAVISGQLGIAENGAVWVTEKDCIHRVLPFITQHLVVILDKNSVVQNMHEAYSKIKVDETGFGLFIAGPSKTADIEQSLVIGAQGARSFTVVLK